MATNITVRVTWPRSSASTPYTPGQDSGKLNARIELPLDACASETKKDIFISHGSEYNNFECTIRKVEVNECRMTKFDFKKDINWYDLS